PATPAGHGRRPDLPARQTREARARERALAARARREATPRHRDPRAHRDPRPPPRVRLPDAAARRVRYTVAPAEPWRRPARAAQVLRLQGTLPARPLLLRLDVRAVRRAQLDEAASDGRPRRPRRPRYRRAREDRLPGGDHAPPLGRARHRDDPVSP